MTLDSRHERYLAALPKDWAVVCVSDLGSIRGGSTPSRKVPRYWGGDIPWVAPGELTGLGAKYLEYTRERVTQAGLDSCGARLLPSETLLVTSRATIGAVALARYPTATNQGFKSLVFKANTNPSFYFHLFKQLVPELERRASGTTFLEISAREFAAVQIPLPPLLEQCRIATVLDTLDDAIRKTEQSIAKLKQLKQGLLYDLLTRGIDENGELRDPERRPEQFTNSLLGLIPKVWKILPFAQFAPRDRPFLKTGPFGSSLKGEHWVDEGVPVITIGALGEGEFIKSELLFVSEKTAASLAAYMVLPGDIVFSRVADVGRSVVVTPAESGWIMSSNLMWISLDAEQVTPDYVWLNLSENSAVRTQVRRSVNVSGREVANGAVLRSIQLAWPSLPEQQKIVAAAQALLMRQHREHENLAKLHLLKQGLMEDLLTGRVRVTHLSNEATP